MSLYLPLTFMFRSGLACPALRCSVCGEAIELLRDKEAGGWGGMIAWDMAKEDGRKDGSLYEAALYPVHKKGCQYRLEAWINSEDGRFGWSELSVFLADLLYNTGFETPVKAEHWVGWGSMYPEPPFKIRKPRKAAPREAKTRQGER